MHACLWDGLDEDLERIAKGVSERKARLQSAVARGADGLSGAAAIRGEIFVQDQIDSSCEEDLKRIAEISPAHFPGQDRPRSG